MKKYLFRVISIILLIAGACLIYYGLDFCLSDDARAMTRKSFHDFYETDVDTIVIGPSHSVFTMNAVKMTDELDESVFNMSTMGQDFKGGYFVLKDAFANDDIKEVYYEFSPSRLHIHNIVDTSEYIISDYLKSPIVKTEMICSLFEPDKYIQSFFRLRRNIDPLDLLEGDDIQKIYKKKNNDNYKNFVGLDNYVGRGYYTKSGYIGIGATAALNMASSNLSSFKINQISYDQWDYLMKSVELCEEKGVKLHFYIAPYPESFYMKLDAYDDIMNMLYEMTSSRGIEVIDFNLVKEEYLNLDMRDFRNLDHLNSAAGERLTDFFIKYIKNPSPDYFYNSYEEKYNDRESVLYAGYSPCYVTDKGEYTTLEKVSGTINSVSVDISAVSYIKIPVDVRLTQVELVESAESDESDDEVSRVMGFVFDPDTVEKGMSGVADNFIALKEIEGERINKYKTKFILPDNSLESFYKIELLEPGTDTVVYEAFTRFDKE